MSYVTDTVTALSAVYPQYHWHGYSFHRPHQGNISKGQCILMSTSSLIQQ